MKVLEKFLEEVFGTMDGFGKMPCEPADTRAAEDFDPDAAFQWAALAAEAVSQGHSERAEELVELAYLAGAFLASCPRHSGKLELQALPAGALAEVGQLEAQ